MRLGISGSSGYPALSLVTAYIEALSLEGLDYIVTGGCAGMVAYAVAKAAERRGIKLESVQSNESVMFDCDELVSFWDGQSQEACYVIEFVSASKPVLIIYPDGTRENVPISHQPPRYIPASPTAKKQRSRRVRDEGPGE